LQELLRRQIVGFGVKELETSDSAHWPPAVSAPFSTTTIERGAGIPPSTPVAPANEALQEAGSGQSPSQETTSTPKFTLLEIADTPGAHGTTAR